MHPFPVRPEKAFGQALLKAEEEVDLVQAIREAVTSRP
jgi:hypothetical protein